MDSLSILPSIISTLLVLAPSLVLLYCLIQKEKYEFIAFLIVSNIAVHLFMMKCIRTNPGIIPQILVNREKDPCLLRIPTVKCADDDKRYLLSNRNLNLYTKHCHECKIFRPPRTIHCNYCNHCVQKYDHHCPWLSVCIGKFNYIYFMGYICSLTVLALYSFGICFSTIIHQIQANYHITSFLAEMIIGSLSIFFGLAIGRLTIYHFIIIYQRRTTNEDLKKIYEKKIQLPFDKCYSYDRRPLFDQNTTYFMDKSYKVKSYHELKVKDNSSNFKEIMLTHLNRDINDSTSSSSSVVIQANRFSNTATQRTSILNYLLQNDSQ